MCALSKNVHPMHWPWPATERLRPVTLHLSHEYFASLQKHAVPLDEMALGGLSHSTMALDIYAWAKPHCHSDRGGD